MSIAHFLHTLAVVAIISTFARAQGPGNGVSKTTYSSTQPWLGAAFNLRYFPVTMAEDSGHDNIRAPDIQGRVQLTKAGQFTHRNCELYSAASGIKTGSGTSMSAPASRGADCVYKETHKYADTTLMWATYAHTADQCCKACAASKGCTNAQYSSAGSARRLRRALQGPQSYEGFGMHLVNVTTSLTTGGIPVSELEAHFDTRLGNMSSFDDFMDYNVVLFAGEDMPTYAEALAKDMVPFFTASWKANTGDTWYSMFVHVPKSQMIFELVGKVSPGTKYETSASLEPRVSPRNVARFASQKTSGVLEAVSVTRACSNISIIEYFYTEAIGATTIHKVDAAGVSRRCFEWPGADSDVCFVSRTGATTPDATFSVRDFETMIWSVHKEVITKVDTYNDKYNDNHYAVDLGGSFSGPKITAFMTAHKDEAFPIDFPKTFYAWDCDQDYLIDPTGWSIQSDFDASYPGCEDALQQ